MNARLKPCKSKNKSHVCAVEVAGMGLFEKDRPALQVDYHEKAPRNHKVA